MHDALGMVDICAMTYAETEQLIKKQPNEVQVLWGKEAPQPTAKRDIPLEY